jgi:hypothetical protein
VDHPFAQRISISLNGIRLTSQFDECIRYHINGYHLRQYMQSKRHWNDRAWESIDFDLFGKHYNSLTAPMQVFQTKLSHDQLPLGKARLQRSQVHYPQVALCPCCHKEQEDVLHFLRCDSNEARNSSLTNLLKDSKFPESHPRIRRTIHDGIQHWIHNLQDEFSPVINDYPLEIQQLILLAVQSQNRLGWDNVLRGFFSKRWTDLASRSLMVPDRTDLQTGHARMRAIIHSIHIYARDIWTSRNKALHSREAQYHNSIRTAEEAEIRTYYENQTILHFDDWYLCDKSLESILNSSSSNKRRCYCVLDQEVQEVCALHPVLEQVPYIFIRHRESNLKARIAWKVLFFLLVMSSYRRWQRRNATRSDGSLAPCCHYAIYKL